MKKFFTLPVMTIAIAFTAEAQHLWYPDKKNGDIIMNEVMVTSTANCSYWETMGWNVGGQGGAYCGIQQSATGPNGTNFIFSIWDPIGTTVPIAAPYKTPNTNVEKFGGEGTGLHYDDAKLIGWKLNTWVRTVSRRWSYNKHSFFGFWSYDYGTNEWIHHVTMDFPVANVYFNTGGTNSFLEDWCTTPANYRKGLYKNGYKRAAGAWIPWNTASYDGNGTSTSDKVANGGIENGAYFMEFGGNTVKTIKEGQVLTIANTATPVLTIGQLSSTSVTSKQDSLLVSWITDKTKSPQFSYTVKIISSAGVLVMSRTDTIPHLRKCALYVKNLTADTYTIRVSMMDIFDQMSNEIDKTIILGNSNGVNDLLPVNTDYFTVYPNPCKSSATILFDENQIHGATAFVYDITGRAVIQNRRIDANQRTMDVSALEKGIYFMEFFNQNKKPVQRLKFVKESE
jgi:Domain of unknown function (DUF3472)/Secretion system C-terminal sorting domain